MGFKKRLKEWANVKNIEGTLALIFFLGLSTIPSSTNYYNLGSKSINYAADSKSSYRLNLADSNRGLGDLTASPNASYCLINYSDNIYDFTTHAPIAPLMDSEVNLGLASSN